MYNCLIKELLIQFVGEYALGGYKNVYQMERTLCLPGKSLYRRGWYRLKPSLIRSLCTTKCDMAGKP
jgi:hypothetical protein